MNERFKHNMKYYARKVLEQVDKSLAFVQKHPVAFERTVLVVGTFYVTRKAYKNFGLKSINAASKSVDAYTSNVVNGYETPSGGRIEILRTISPAPFEDVHDAAYVAHLEVRDLDIYDMNEGHLLGMIFNVKDLGGVKNTPLAVMPYERFMDHVKDGFPVHNSAQELLSENTRSNFVPIMDQYFGSKS